MSETQLYRQPGQVIENMNNGACLSPHPGVHKFLLTALSSFFTFSCTRGLANSRVSSACKGRPRQAAWWTKHANLNFDFSDAPNARIRITFDLVTF